MIRTFYVVSPLTGALGVIDTETDTNDKRYKIVTCPYPYETDMVDLEDFVAHLARTNPNYVYFTN